MMKMMRQNFSFWIDFYVVAASAVVVVVVVVVERNIFYAIQAWNISFDRK